jgi:hypothetical protein
VRAEALAQRVQGEGHRAYTRALHTINNRIKAMILFLMLVLPFRCLLAGFTAGVDQIGMVAVAVALIAKSTSTLRC